MISAVAIVLVLGGLIFFHELGHFGMARALGIGVRAFSLGFGPVLFKFRGGKTEYRLSAVPLGGYVSLAGENPKAPASAEPDGFTPRELFFNRPAWQRMLVVAAGPFSNFLLAWLIYLCIALTVGNSVPLPVIGKILDNTPAMEAGLQAGDRVVRLNDQQIDTWIQLQDFMTANGPGTVSVTVKRGDLTQEIDVTPKLMQRTGLDGEDQSAYLLGISPSMDAIVWQPVSLVDAVPEATDQTVKNLGLIVKNIAWIFQGRVSAKEIGGPILIAQAIGQQAEAGFADVLFLAAFISINLGLINILPIPVLDGGHLLFFGIEIVFRRPVSERWQAYGTKIGLALLLTLMLFATYNDILRVVTK